MPLHLRSLLNTIMQNYDISVSTSHIFVYVSMRLYFFLKINSLLIQTEQDLSPKMLLIPVRVFDLKRPPSRSLKMSAFPQMQKLVSFL